MTWTTREKYLSAALIVALVLVAGLVIFSVYRIQNIGRIRAVGIAIFWDVQATQPVTSIDWGYMSPGELKGATVYIRNIKSLNVSLSQNTTEWVPALASQYITADWNYTGQILGPGQQICVMLTLQVSIDIRDVDTFSYAWDIWANEA